MKFELVIYGKEGEGMETRNKSFSIRYAERKDAPLILWFIKEMASYEGEAHCVTATEEILLNSLFERKAAEVIIGEYDGKPVSFALFHNTFSNYLGKPGIHIVDLYIIPEVRGKGLGKIMLSYLAKLAVQRDCGRLEWWCHNWNASAISFYKKQGAVPLEELKTYRLTGKALESFSEEF